MSSSEDFAALVQVVDNGGFSAAARALGLTPSAVSKQIGRLEDRLGVRLLNRTTRRVGLTEVGTVFYARAVRILADIDEAERAAMQLSAEPRGHLRVGASIAFGRRQIMPIIADFLARYAEMTVELALSDRVIDLVEEGVDVAIRSGPLPDSSLIARRLAPDHRIVCAAPAYLERHGKPKTPADLANHNCLTFSGLPTLNEWTFEGPETVKVRGNFEANNGDALRDGVLAGLGIARLAAFLVGPDVKAGRLVALFEDRQPRDDSAINVLYPHHRHLSPKVRVFVDYLVERMTPVPPWA